MRPTPFCNSDLNRRIVMNYFNQKNLQMLSLGVNKFRIQGVNLVFEITDFAIHVNEGNRIVAITDNYEFEKYMKSVQRKLLVTSRKDKDKIFFTIGYYGNEPFAEWDTEGDSPYKQLVNAFVECGYREVNAGKDFYFWEIPIYGCTTYMKEVVRIIDNTTFMSEDFVIADGEIYEADINGNTVSFKDRKEYFAFN